MERLRLGREAWNRFEAGIGLEWLETNGLGGWAYGTVPNVNTRFYHAMLAAALHPPTERVVLLARLEEVLEVDGVSHPLYGNWWSDGHREEANRHLLQSFTLDPFPTWLFAVGETLVEKRLFMRHGQNCTVVRYRVWRGAGAGPVTLHLSPLVTCRSIHAVLRANDWPFAQEQAGPAAVALEPMVGGPRLYLAQDGGEYQPGGGWVHGFHYPYETLRGEATEEDLYLPGRFSWTGEGSGELTFVAAAEPVDRVEGAAWEEAERQRRAALLVQAGLGEGDGPASAGRQLVLTADQFVVRRASTGRVTLIAGYPWFTDWGRDAMIALPGLLLVTGRHAEARELLQTFAAYMADGLIPNCFPEEGERPLYNTADASLWFFEAAWQYLRATGDAPFVLGDLYPVLVQIAEAHLAGTHFGIGMTEEGLLRCGSPDLQVTWMDARCDDWVVTPRDGLPVEIQALWYNALRILSGLAAHLGDGPAAERWEGAAQRVEQAFHHFWNPDAGCCYDRLADDGTPDAAIRPNQLLALSLTHPLLAGDAARSVVDVAFRELLTPFGLRSLSARDPAYSGRYLGTRLQRDAVYHQGTVWGWLMGPFIRAYLRAYGRTPERLAHAQALVQPLQRHLSEFGLGTVAEIFDGDPPHLPRGCPAQAWSVAELLRLLRDDLA